MHYYGILAGGSFWHKNSCIKDCLDCGCLVPTLVAGYSRALGLRSACGSLTVSPEPLGQFPARNGEQSSPESRFGCNLSAPWLSPAIRPVPAWPAVQNHSTYLICQH